MNSTNNWRKSFLTRRGKTIQLNKIESDNTPLRYFLFNKPYGVLCQFTDKEGRKIIGDYYSFPPEVYPAGRLDLDSEGLLLLTNDKELTHFLLNPKNKHEREYYVQVEGVPDISALKRLENGLIIENKKTLAAKAKIINNPNFPQRMPPVRFRKTIPTSWLSLTLIEGRNRQVRKMTAAIGYPTLRLVRVRILNLLLDDLKPGEVKEIFIENFHLHK
ncbi:MAG: pseudouridine synthase [Ignavibacteriaceae bacterium]|nr:pseudouridine synthase [Ignavibacteriaceae bacterium]